MHVRVKWADNQSMTLLGESASGHGVIMDADSSIGGKNLGIRPMEMLLIGAGGCTSIDVITFLKKNNQEIFDCIVDIDGERSESTPKVFKKVHMHYTIIGKNIDENHVKHAIQLSTAKYCSATITLAQLAEVSHDYEIVEL